MIELSRMFGNRNIIIFFVFIRQSSDAGTLLNFITAVHAETKQYKELSEIFSKPHNDNQEVFQMLFALKDEIPLKDCSSQAQVGFSQTASTNSLPKKWILNKY